MASHNKVAIITGAGSGIGKAVALAFLNDGYRVALAGRRQDALEGTIKEAGKNGANAIAVPTDVSKPDEVKNLFSVTRDKLGRVDVVAELELTLGISRLQAQTRRFGQQLLQPVRLPVVVDRAPPAHVLDQLGAAVVDLAADRRDEHVRTRNAMVDQDLDRARQDSAYREGLELAIRPARKARREAL